MHTTQEVKPTAMPVSLTTGAIGELTRIMKDQGVPAGFGLRIGLKGGGCSGFSYMMGFDSRKEGDQEFLAEGLKILINEAHGPYLAGTEIDYLDDLSNRGFVFHNPNARETCGCGSSFSA